MGETTGGHFINVKKVLSLELVFMIERGPKALYITKHPPLVVNLQS
jgi:hypothetical protein